VGHVDDEFHPPTTDDPYWTETCWFTFAVPERRLSAQLYPFFRPNQGVCAAAAYAWDPTGDQPWNARYAKGFWHLPLPDQPLSDLTLPNGIRYRCLEPLSTYELHYLDPDDGAFAVDLIFTGVLPPNRLAESHLDQPGRYTGTLRLEGEEMAVDAYGMRDRSWGPRSQFGADLHGSGAVRGGYSYATASPHDGFHAITMDWGDGAVAIHGYVNRNGEYSTLASGRRTVLAREAGAPSRVALELTDEAGRTLTAEGRTLNRFGLHLNPNLFTWNCLTEWTWDGGTGFGEDHDNWSAAGARRFFADPANRDGEGTG
jgi:hypothetical protein